MSDRKTPDEWCQIEGVEILDPDGWRGRDGRPWTDAITRSEFRDRLLTCTQRSIRRPDDRTEMEAARSAGLEKRHERRLESATYTAAEVKVLTETASKVAYALGRKDAGEEIAKACMERAEESNYGLEESAFVDAAHLCQEIASQPAPDASEPRTDPGMDSDLPPAPEALQEDA